MDEKENGLPQDEFDLDDLMKEFGGTSDDDVPVDVDDEDIRIWNGEILEQPQTQIPGDTVRLDSVVDAIREVEASADDSDVTIRFTPVGQPEDVAPPVMPEPEKKAEPFSKDWEPEYEDPISDYIPPQPIVFRPKNRLRELKKKLIEGPERRYYELEAQGTGKLQFAIILSCLVSLVAAGTVVLHHLGMVSPERTRLMVYGQGLMLRLSAMLGSFQLIGGIADLVHKRFTLDTLFVFSILACCADAILCLRQLRIPCCAAFCLHMTMSLISAHHKRTTEMAQMDTLRRAVRLDSLVLTPDYYEGRPGYLRGEGQVEDFMDNYSAPSGPEKVMSVYALTVLFLSLAGSVAVGVLYSVSLALQVFSAALLVAVPVSMHVTLSRPAALLQRRLKKHGSVICGWQGVLGLSRPAAFPLTDTDLFPLGSAKLNGVKFYGKRDPDQVVAYAAALIGADGGTMAPLVAQLLESRSGYHYDVTELQSYPGGIGGIVDDEAVLAGTLSFLQSMGVEMPKGTKVNQAVYVAIDGELAGVFAVTYNRVKASAVGLTTLCAYRRLIPVMVTGDFMLTDSFLRGKFGVNTKRIAFPPRQVRAELAQKQADPETVALAMSTNEELAGIAYAVTGARALRSSSIAGMVIHMLGGILGMLILAALMIVGADHLLTPGNILLYELVWMIPGLLICEWTRSV